METQFFLWVGVFAQFLLFAFLAYTRKPQHESVKQYYYLILTVIGVAVISYLLMALGYGDIVIHGKQFFFVRYVDWMLSTPIILAILSLIAIRDKEERKKTILKLVLLDESMLLTGFWAVTVADPVLTQILFIFSTLLLVAIVFIIVRTLRRNVMKYSESIRVLFRYLSLLLIVLWSLYPIVWFMSVEVASLISVSTEVGIYTVLDIFAKGLFGYLLLSDQKALAHLHGEVQSLDNGI